MSQISKNDAAWVRLFEQHKILEEIHKVGVFHISASQINQFREARLMTKFDHRVNLPQIFRANNLCILPNSRGTYIIGHFDVYENIAANSLDAPIEFPFPTNLETIDYKNLYSEVSALLCAYNSGIIADIVGGPVNLTVFGRMSTSQFTYRVKNNQNNDWYTIDVDNAQCEIDAGFEGESVFVIVEAKNYSADDFLIRQLYYPYRLWREKTSKAVIPIFMSYSNDVFRFLIYKFSKLQDYNSIELVAQKNYQIASERIELEDLWAVFQASYIRPEPSNIPIPQADNFRRVIDLLGLLYVSNLSQQEITLKYQFTVRQTQYYTAAVIYLGLVQRYRDDDGSVNYKLSDDGKSILAKPAKKKYLAIAEKILQHEVFYKTMAHYFDKSERPTLAHVEQIMQNAELIIDAETTIHRRSQTVLGWVNWIFSLLRSE